MPTGYNSGPLSGSRPTGQAPSGLVGSRVDPGHDVAPYKVPDGSLSRNDLHYLRSIHDQLEDTLKFIRRRHDFGILLGIEILADNIDWLDCFIDQHGRGQ